MDEVLTHKICTGCLLNKPLEEFYRGDGAGRRRAKCKACCAQYVDKDRSNEASRRHRENNPEAHLRSQRKSWLNRMYGITIEEYEALVENHGGRCAICQTGSPGRGRRFWPVDHDHVTGEVRGILCSNCNAGLGLLGDDPTLLRAALAYLDGDDG